MLRKLWLRLVADASDLLFDPGLALANVGMDLGEAGYIPYSLGGAMARVGNTVASAGLAMAHYVFVRTRRAEGD